MRKRYRLDNLLVERGFFQSRNRAQAAVMEGNVLVNNIKKTKPGSLVDEDAKIEIIGDQLPYVSRGGLKLEKAIQVFDISFKEKTVLDIGASTGGYTDCALQKGAKKVFAVDVGYGQLAWKLRNDPRVINMERVNARYLTPEDIGEKVDIVTLDVSFISLEKVVSACLPLVKEGGELVALIKPQFEAGKEKVGKKGVVKDPQVHIEVLEQVTRTLNDLGLRVLNLTFSPIRGPKGNIEYLAYGVKEPGNNECLDIPGVVEEAWSSL